MQVIQISSLTGHSPYDITICDITNTYCYSGLTGVTSVPVTIDLPTELSNPHRKIQSYYLIELMLLYFQ